MKKILLSLSIIVFVGAIAVGATGAFFSDTETTTGNTFTAGAIDLGIDNESYYNGVFNDGLGGTSWTLSFDLDDGLGSSTENGAYLFYNFDDLKPGDYGEDTISIHVNNNPAWICAYTTVQTDSDNDCTEPEDDDDANCGTGNADENGDLANEIEIMWWADDGDNVLEEGEQVLDQGDLGQAPLGSEFVSPLADSNNNIWTDQNNDPAPGATTLYIAKAWCFGDIEPAPFRNWNDSDTGPDTATNAGLQSEVTSEDGGFICDGAGSIGNASQTDSVTLDVGFTAVQSRNNDDFTCGPRQQT